MRKKPFGKRNVFIFIPNRVFSTKCSCVNTLIVYLSVQDKLRQSMEWPIHIHTSEASNRVYYILCLQSLPWYTFRINVAIVYISFVSVKCIIVSYIKNKREVTFLCQIHVTLRKYLDTKLHFHAKYRIIGLDMSFHTTRNKVKHV